MVNTGWDIGKGVNNRTKDRNNDYGSLVDDTCEYSRPPSQSNHRNFAAYSFELIESKAAGRGTLL
jgi:hypothetical protein